MQYFGKIIGVMVAVSIGSGFWGIFISLIIGHLFDTVAHKQKLISISNKRERQKLFFITTFEVMGHLSKSKGRVTTEDIQVAITFMDRMNLRGKSRAAAQNAFRIGKSDNYPLRKKIREFRNVHFGHFDLIRIFLELQIQIAFSDGNLHPNERIILYVIAEELGISRNQFHQFLRMMQNRFQYNQDAYQKEKKGTASDTYSVPQSQRLKDACNILGVKPNDDEITIKRAYRKLMSKHHPDKLVAKGLPPEMMEMAKKKAQEIQKTYELIKEKKGF